jgi:tetratricopeptide (TPR) repeat protein
MYLSLAGAALAAGWGLARAPRAAWAASLVAAGAFGVQSFDRARTWRSDDAAYTAVLAGHDSPGARYYFAFTAFTEATDLLRRAQTTPDAAARAEATSRARALLETSLEHEHRAIAVWRAYDPTPKSRSRILRRFEVVAARVCYLLARHEEALFHAEAALAIDPTLDAMAEHERAMPLLALGFAHEAAESMKRAQALGFARQDAEVCAFFVLAGAKCEDDGLPRAAETCYLAAVDAAPDAVRRRDAEDRLFALRRRPPPSGGDADERTRRARLDEELSRLRRSCPERGAGR